MCMCICIYSYVYMCAWVWGFAWVYIRMYKCIYMYVCVMPDPLYTFIHTIHIYNGYIYIMYIYVCMCNAWPIHVWHMTRLYVMHEFCITHTLLHSLTHAHAHIHTHTHTHTHPPHTHTGPVRSNAWMVFRCVFLSLCLCVSRFVSLYHYINIVII